MTMIHVSLFLVCGLFALPAFGGDEAQVDLAERASRLADDLADPKVRLSDEQRAEVRTLLKAAATVIEARAGAAGPGACYNEAYRELSREVALELCEGGGDLETARCFKEAKGVLQVDQAVRLCKSGGTIRTLVCYNQARRHLTVEKSIDLCTSRGTEETAGCLGDAVRTLPADQAITHCRRH